MGPDSGLDRGADPGSELGRKPADEVLAAELALGVLGPAARARAEARCGTDDALAAEALDWARRLHPLAEEVAPVTPPSRLWDRISAAIAPPSPAPTTSGPTTSGPPTSAPPVSAAPPAAEPAFTPAASAVAAWRAVALGACVVAAGAVAVAATRARGPGAASLPLLSARLAPAQGGAALLPAGPLYVAAVDRARAVVLLTPVGSGPVDPRGRELWLMPRAGRPTALGSAAGSQAKLLRLPAEAAKAAEPGATLAVTLEPAASPVAPAPTGPVIASGPLERP